MTISTVELRQALFHHYGGFADKRLRNTSRNAAFAIDGRTSRDMGADGKLYSYFCQMLAFVDDAYTVRIVMRGALPGGRDIAAWFSAHNTTSVEGGVEFCVVPAALPELADLASRIGKSGVSDGKGARLRASRTAASLRQLHDQLATAWREVN